MKETFNHTEVQTTIQCQRNWDWDNPIKPEDLKLLDEYVQKPPQQQGAKLFGIINIDNNYVAVDRLQVMCFNPTSGKKVSNPQTHMLSPTVYIWTYNNTAVQEHGIQKVMMQIGIHIGIVIRKADELGYKTGFIACGPHTMISWKSWCHSFDIDSTSTGHEHFVFALAVGNGKQSQDYNNDQLIESTTHYHVPYNWPDFKKV